MPTPFWEIVMLPSENDSIWQRTLPRAICQRREEGVRIQDYTAYVQQDRRLRAENIFYRPFVAPPPRIPREKVMAKIRFREAQSRRKLDALFKAEYVEYQKMQQQMRPTDDDLYQQLEKRVVGIRAARAEQRDQFNLKMRELQAQNSDDEIRQAQQLIQQKATVLAWNQQNIDRRRREELEKQIQKSLDQITIDDYKKYLNDLEAEFQRRQERIRVNRAALDQQLTEQEKSQAADAAKRREEDAEELRQHAFFTEIAKAQRDLDWQEKIVTRAELDIQVKLNERARQTRKQLTRQEYVQLKGELEEEQLQERRRGVERQQQLLQEQTIYCELVRKRKERLREETRQLEAFFAVEQERMDREKYEKSQRMQVQRRLLAQDCRRYNEEAAEKERAGVQRELDRKRELECALEELHRYEEDRLREAQEELIQQQIIRDYYEADILRKRLERAQNKEADIVEARKPDPRDVERQRLVAAKKLELQTLLSELDGIEPFDDGGPRKPRRQWYNV